MDSGLLAIDDLRSLAPTDTDRLGHSTVLDAAGARVILLSFPDGHVLREHRTPQPLLLQAVEGHLRITAAGRTTDLRPGGLMFLPASMPHEVAAIGASQLVLTLLPTQDRTVTANPS